MSGYTQYNHSSYPLLVTVLRTNLLHNSVRGKAFCYHTITLKAPMPFSAIQSSYPCQASHSGTSSPPVCTEDNLLGNLREQRISLSHLKTLAYLYLINMFGFKSQHCCGITQHWNNGVSILLRDGEANRLLHPPHQVSWRLSICAPGTNKFGKQKTPISFRPLSVCF